MGGSVNWFALIVFLVTTIISPGPNNLTSLAGAAQAGWRAMMPFCFGVGLANGLLVVCMGLAMASVERWMPALSARMPLIGAVYFLYLAYRTAKNAFCPPSSGRTLAALPGFWAALPLQLVNVKALATGFACVSGYLSGTGYPLSLVSVVALLRGVLSWGCCCFWAVGGSLLSGLFTRYPKGCGLAITALLLWCAYSMAHPALVLSAS